MKYLLSLSTESLKSSGMVMFDDLNAYERAVLKDVLIATKRALRENKGIMD